MFPEVSLQSWKFLGGLLPQRSLAWVCSCGGWLPSCLGLFWRRVLAWADLAEVAGLGSSHVCPCLGPAPAEVAGLALILWRSLSLVCSHRCADVPGVGPLPPRLCARARPVHRGCWLRSVPSVVSPSYLFPRWSLDRACPSGSHCPFFPTQGACSHEHGK